MALGLRDSGAPRKWHAEKSDLFVTQVNNQAGPDTQPTRQEMHVIGRRHVTFVTGAVLAAPIACRAQTQQKLPVVGILNAAHGSSPEDHAKHPFVVGLRELGWEEGKDFHFATAYGEGRVDRLPELAAALVAKKVDVIVTGLPRDCSPLAVYKRLEHLLLLPALPRNPVGMVHKRDLRDLQRVQTA